MGRSDRSGDEALERPLPPDVAALVADSEPHETGFFGPDSVMWKISRERVLLLSGVSTILLQLAHPKVAAGIADHSHFDENPIGRFRRTFDGVHAIIFGDVGTAVEAALEIRATHARVTGTMSEDAGPFAATDRYAASDPDLLLWVHATLIDQSLTAYETYVASLSAADREQYYRECLRFGRLLGIRGERYPETVSDFYDYYEQMLEEEITVSNRGKERQRALFDQGRVFGPLYEFLGASTLPDAVRAGFGLPWAQRRQRVFDEGASLLGTVLSFLPPRLRYVSAYRRARARLQ